MSDATEVVEAEVVEAEVVDDRFAETLVPVDFTSRAPARIIGGIPYLQEYLELATQIAKTAMVPTALRGQPEQLLAVMMYGAELGIGPMQAMQQINFIEGKPSMAPELMRALIRKAGHRLNITQTQDECVIVGERGDTGEVGESGFSVADAVDAGLCRVVDGKVQARSSNGNKLPWEKYTKDMLLARATSRIARMMFSDVISGMSYTPEEVESFTERPAKSEAKKSTRASKKQSGTTLREPPKSEPVEEGLADEDEMTTLRTAMSMLEESDRARFADEWKRLADPAVPPMRALRSEHVERLLALVGYVLNDVTGEPYVEVHEEHSEAQNRSTGTSQVNPENIGPPLASPQQVKMIRAKLKNIGYETKGGKERVEEIIGHHLEHLTHLTKPEAHKVIDQLIEDEK